MKLPGGVVRMLLDQDNETNPFLILIRNTPPDKY